MHPTRSAYGDLAQVVTDHDGPLAAIADFLHALDRGDFGDLRIGPSYDRSESAFILALRRQVEGGADRALTAGAHRRGAAVADALYGEARS